MIGSVLILGAMLGVRHALEADHIAAVASLATRARSSREILKVSAAWGLGHAGTLLIFGSLVIALGATLSDRLSRVLELGVGLMLLVLGADVLRRLRRSRVHVHRHVHDDGSMHLHAHRHDEVEESSHSPEQHQHDHPPMSRALLVGSVHGLAGSAALVLLSVQATKSAAAAVGYLIAFGVGSVLGMVAFSLVISMPLRLSGQRFDKPVFGVEALLGFATMAIGAWVAFHAGVF